MGWRFSFHSFWAMTPPAVRLIAARTWISTLHRDSYCTKVFIDCRDKSLETLPCLLASIGPFGKTVHCVSSSACSDQLSLRKLTVENFSKDMPFHIASGNGN
jgi:hypothetical protein